MELDSALPSAESCPGEKGETEIDCRRIEGVERLVELDAQRVACIELSGPRNEDGSKVRVDTPIAILVGLGQGVASDVSADAHVI